MVRKPISGQCFHFCPLKIPENQSYQRFSGVSRRNKNENIGQKWVNFNFIMSLGLSVVKPKNVQQQR